MTTTDALLSTIHLSGEGGLTACGRLVFDGGLSRKVNSRPIFVTCSACIETLTPTAWPSQAPVYFSKEKNAGLWSPARYFSSFTDAMASIRDTPWPAVIADGITSEIVYVNAHAADIGMQTVYESSTDVCPIHGEGCEAWA